MKSGPDVFADALVPKALVPKAFVPTAFVPQDAVSCVLKVPNPALPFSKSPKLAPAIHASRESRIATPVVSGDVRHAIRPGAPPIAANGYRFAKWHGKPNSRIAG
jgi:hypothetical protein